jgi:hypothetical protein
MAWSPSVLLSPWVLRLDFFSISSLSSVGDDGSPGSWLLIFGISIVPLAPGVALDRVRARFVGGTVVSIDCGCLLCLAIDAGASASSSPEASREEGCCITAVSDFRRSLGMCEVLFRLAEPLEDGDDISTSLSYRPAIWFKKGCNLTWPPRSGQCEKQGLPN